jgi:7-cyano-7-deazaguanine reductase
LGIPENSIVGYKDRYDPHLLFPVSRQPQREEIGIQTPLPFWGADIWTAYELSWIDPRGKPQIAIATLYFTADSPQLIESKSLKQYLNSFNQTSFKNTHEVQTILTQDLSRASGCPVEVLLKSSGVFGQERIEELPGESLDRLKVDIRDYQVNPDFLEAGSPVVEETLVSNLLKTNCPITGQPDWAAIQIRYRGPRMVHDGLLKYLVSYRQHQDFHENCVERIFMDLRRRCRPEKLTVYACYTRRGGIEINPFRTNFETTRPVPSRTARQ